MAKPSSYNLNPVGVIVPLDMEEARTLDAFLKHLSIARIEELTESALEARVVHRALRQLHVAVREKLNGL